MTLSNVPDVAVYVDIDAPYVDKTEGKTLEKAAYAAIAAAADDGNEPAAAMEMSVRLTGDEEIRELNREYRGVDRPTDVLSWSLLEGELPDLPEGMALPLGDVVISVATARRQAEELAHSLEMELSWLVIHGTLQLLGYAHAEETEAAHMEELEAAALRSLGFTRRPS